MCRDVVRGRWTCVGMLFEEGGSGVCSVAVDVIRFSDTCGRDNWKFLLPVDIHVWAIGQQKAINKM